MKLGIMCSSISNGAGGMFGAMVGQNLAIARVYKPEIQIFGLEDERSSSDLALWKNLNAQTYPIAGPRKFAFSPQLLPALLNANLDLLHVHGLWMYPSVASRKWAHSTSRPYVVSSHGMLDRWAIQNAHWKKVLAGTFFERGHLQNAACLQAVSLAEVDAIRAYGLRNPICHIPYGIDLPQGLPIARSSENRSKRLLFLGRLHPKKGLTNLIHAWHRVQGNQSIESGKWVLTIAGWDQGGHEQQLKRLVSELGLVDSVHFVGAKFGSDKDKLLAESDAFILPSYSEGLPVAVLEAWSYGLPVLITPACNIPEGYACHAAVHILPQVEAIENGLLKLIVMTDLQRQSMGRQGRRLVETQFTWERAARDMVAVYRWILGEGSRPACVMTS
ncbi:MAG: glycosyltransferase [Nitrospira sp.]